MQFFDRDTYPDSDLDVYVEHRYVRVLTDWLVNIGYEYKPLSDAANMATLDAALLPTPLSRSFLYAPQQEIYSRFRTTTNLRSFSISKRGTRSVQSS